MSWVLIVATVWVLLAVAAALALGRAVRTADRREAEAPLTIPDHFFEPADASRP
jgi:hypothetical protein